jgi:hypothetical protein
MNVTGFEDPTVRTLLLIVSIAIAAPALAAPAAPANIVRWKADLDTLRRELPVRHPAPFLNVSRARWDSAATALDRQLPTMSRNRALVGFMRLVAMIGDAHTDLDPGPALGLRFYPLELYSFDDGLFVRRADSTYAALVGAKVLRIGRVSADEAMARVAPIVPHENEWWLRSWAPFQLTIPEVLNGLGIAGDVEHLPLVLEREGRVDTVRIAPAGRIADQHGHGPVPIDMSGWASMRTAPAPWWEQQPDELFWWRFDPPSRTLYACVRAVAPSPGTFTNRPQWDRVFALADSVGPDRFVLDLRENTGGNGTLNRYPVQQLLRRPALDRSGHLFVIIGRRTFFAGQQFTNLLEAWTQATLVGEPSGQRPSQYGDHRPLVLPVSGMTVQISSIFHQAPNEFDDRTYVPPRIYTPLDSKSYREGDDPALRAILTPDTTAPLIDVMARALASGDTATAERALASARNLTVNRFRSFERDVNALGYRLAGSGQHEPAIQAFRINARAFPRSANAFDSLGEALLGGGYRDAAIAAYRRALEVQPGFGPSAQALQRLGVQ